MRHFCLKPVSLPPDYCRCARPLLALFVVLALNAAPGLAQECPTWSFGGSITTGDGSTMPGKADLWVTNTPTVGYYGSYSQGEAITISGGGNVGNWEERWYAISGGYFWSPITGSITCTRPEGSNCGSCSGGFSVKLYASQGAVHGTVRVIPEREEGLAGIPVWLSRNPSGGSNPTYTDELGHFEFRADEGLARSNNWGVGVDADYSPWPHSGEGSATYYVGSAGAAVDVVEVTSSQLAEANLVVRLPRCEDPEMRCDTGGSSSGDNGPSPPKEAAGKPVNVITGNVYFDQTDIFVPGVQGLAFVRSYNSKNAFNDLESVFSRGWTHTYSRALSFPDAISIDFRGDDGVPLYYQDVDGDGIFDAALPATERTKVVLQDYGFRREIPGGAYETYDPAGGLTSIVDRSGNAVVFERNSDGLLSKVTDPGGRSLTLSYDDRDRIAMLVAGSEVVAAYEYDDDNFLQRVNYPDGSGFTFTYDGRGQVLRVEDASGRAIESHEYGSYDTASFALTSEIADGQEKLTFTYEPWRTTVTNAMGHVTVYDWRWINGLRRIIKIVGSCTSCGGGGAESQEWEYDARGRIVKYWVNGGDPFTYEYDSAGRMATTRDPLGRVTTYTYDDVDRPLTVATPGGGLLSATYGLHGPVSVTEKVTEAVSRTTSYSYTANGQLESVRNPRGNITTYAYDTNGDPLSVTDPLGNVTSFSYDELGRRTVVTDALGNATAFSYDSRGRLLSATEPDETAFMYEYDLGGRRVATTNPLGQTYRYIFDAYGRLVEEVDPMEGSTLYGYDVVGRMISLTNPKGQTMAFGYDSQGRMIETIYPNGAIESFTYNGRGFLETKTDRTNVVTTFSYDEMGRLTSRAYSDGTPALNFTYDIAGRLETAANGSDNLSWDYDLAGQVLSETSNRNGSVVTYAYDSAGNRLSVSLNGQLFVSHEYDNAGRVSSIGLGTKQYDFAYDEIGRRTSMAYPNSVVTSYGYDEMDRIIHLGAILGGATTITSFDYVHDAAGNRVRKEQLDYAENYVYDALLRLTRVDRSGLPENWHFSYDEVGNRVTNQRGSDVTTAIYDEGNRLLSVAGGGGLVVRGNLDEPAAVTVNGEPAPTREGNFFETVIQATPGANTFTVEATDMSGNSTTQDYEVEVSGTDENFDYDANGNLIQKTREGQTWSYEWDAENQLTRVNLNGATVASYEYDPLGRRVGRVDFTTEGAETGPTSWGYIYDGSDILRMSTPGDGSGGPKAVRYVHGPGVDEPLSEVDEHLGVASHFHADGLGSVVAITNDAGTIIHEYRYDAWGNLERGQSRAGYAYTGREWDPESNLYCYRFRYYDPQTGRFISEDPIGLRGGLNLFAYVGNDVPNSIDPFGLTPELPNCTASPWVPGEIYAGDSYTKRQWRKTGQEMQFILPGPRGKRGGGARPMQCICYWELVGVLKITDVWQDFEREVTCKTDSRCIDGSYTYTQSKTEKFGEREEEIPMITPRNGVQTTTVGPVGCWSCPKPPD